MITERGWVRKIDNDAIWVETIRRSACNSCNARAGCGQKLVNEWDGETALIRVLASPEQLRNIILGTEVKLGIAEDTIANGALMLYGIPLMGLVLFTSVAHWLGGSDAVTAVASLFGLLGGGMAVRYLAARRFNDCRVQPVLL